MKLGQRTKSGVGGTARRILDYARRAINERGVGAIGPREIARDLGLSPGNVSYHFPTKETLVTALLEEVHAQNNALVASLPASVDFALVDAVIRAIMRRDLDNQWVMRDSVSLLLAMPALRPFHERMHSARAARVDAVVARLVAAGLLDRDRAEGALPRLRRQVLTQIFFWVPAAILAAPDRDPAESLDDHARAALALFLPFCTPTGRRMLDPLLDRPPAEVTRE